MTDDDTGTFEAVDTERHEAIVTEQAPPPGGPPRGAWMNDVWPWLALLGLLAVAGLLVWLFVLRRDHHRARVVPAVVGLQQQAAISRLTRAGYSVKAIRGPAKRPLGVVVSQAPGGGSQLPKGAAVTLHVSNGKAPPTASTTTTTATATTSTSTTTTSRTTTAAAPSSQVPDVTGQEMAAGAGQVEAAGFVADTAPVQGGGAPGSIVQESPPGGTQAKAGDTVTLGVAVGASPPAVQIPDVAGKTAGDARAALLQAKLTVRTTYKTGRAGIVLAESPTGTAPAYTQVTITVGRR